MDVKWLNESLRSQNCMIYHVPLPVLWSRLQNPVWDLDWVGDRDPEPADPEPGIETLGSENETPVSEATFRLLDRDRDHKFWDLSYFNIHICDIIIYTIVWYPGEWMV